jgi:hypothetical protein
MNLVAGQQLLLKQPGRASCGHSWLKSFFMVREDGRSPLVVGAEASPLHGDVGEPET